MGITNSFTEPFFTGGTVVSQVPAIYEVAVDGRGYFLDLESPYSQGLKHSSIPLIRQQADQADEPGETSLNPEDLWRRSVDTWHLGAGQTYLDASDSDRGRFRRSKGIDPWTQGQITLHQATDQKVTSTNDVQLLAVAGGYLYLLDGDTLQYTLDIDAASFTGVGGVFNNARSIASDGYNVWVVDDTDLYYTNRGTTTYTAWLPTPQPGSLVRYVKGMLFVVSGTTIYNPGAQDTNAVQVFDHPNRDWTWVDIAEGPNAVYLGGYAGDKSIIYRTAFNTTLSVLDVPTVAATLPDGEVVRSLQGYLGFVLVGTDKGLRFAVASSDGGLELGDLIRLTPVQCFEPQDRFVWFGWSNYDGDSTGLGRVDLRSLNGTQPAYASDLMATGQGATTSVVTFEDRRVFCVAGLGTFAQSASKVVSGTVDSGLIGFRLSSSKTALFLETQHRQGEGSYQAAISVDESTFVNVGTAAPTSQTEAGLETVSTGQLVGELFEIRFTLNRSPLDDTQAPVIGRSTLRADPQAPRRYKIQVPIMLAETVQGQSFDIAFERQQIKALAQSRRPVNYQEGITSYTVIVEDFEWVPYARTGPYNFDYSGTLNVTLKTLS
jgi:hypothetical protein